MKAIIIFMVVFGLTNVLYPQDIKKQKSRHLQDKNLFANAKIDNTKSAVYITFDKISTIVTKKHDKSDSDNIVWLKLHNNLKGLISFYSYDVSVSPTGKIGVHYMIEKNSNSKTLCKDTEDLPLGFPPFDFVDFTILESGKYFYFGIPQHHLIKNTRIAIQIFYPWQVGNESPSDETLNFVYFYENTIPEKID